MLKELIDPIADFGKGRFFPVSVLPLKWPDPS